jgi:hypothetical protein
MRRSGLQQLEKMAAKLSATARTLPPGQDRQDAFREIAKFRDQIAAIKIADYNQHESHGASANSNDAAAILCS